MLGIVGYTEPMLAIPSRLETVKGVVEYWTHESGTRFASVVTEDSTFLNIALDRLLVCEYKVYGKWD